MLSSFVDLSTRARPMLGAQLTTFAIGGQIPKFIETQSVEELSEIVSELRARGEPYRIIGAGSNLLISSAGIQDWVIRLGKGFRSIEERASGHFVVGASTSLMTLSRELSEKGFSGLEFAGGIPASLGGAVRMNAGAHGGQMADIIESITIVNESGEGAVIQAKQLNFRYRHSELPVGSIVTGATLKLTPGDPQRSRELRSKYLSERKQRQPLTVPSAGSVFKNPPQKRAGECIEACGLKGFSIGKAQVSEMHGNWIVNPERLATHGEVLGLMQHCQERVKTELGITLESEVVLWC